jgi:hypothetical protein
MPKEFTCGRQLKMWLFLRASDILVSGCSSSAALPGAWHRQVHGIAKRMSAPERPALFQNAERPSGSRKAFIHSCRFAGECAYFGA